MAIRHDITLSTTEPNNDIGLLKIRQADEQTQTLVVQLTATSQPKSYEGLQAFFCAKLGQSIGLGIIEQKLEQSEMTNPKAGQLEYTFRAEDWQQIGRQVGYFSFRKMKDDGHEYVEQFTTRDFYFNVTKSVFSDGLTEMKTPGSTYVWTIEDLIRLFNEYIASGKSDWEEFVDQNREVLESVDPGGLILSELIRSRKPEGAETPYPDLPTRLDEQIGKNSEFREFEPDKSFMRRVFNESVERDVNARWYGIEGDGLTDNTDTMTNIIETAEKRIMIPYSNDGYVINELLLPMTKTFEGKNTKISVTEPDKRAFFFFGNEFIYDPEVRQFEFKQVASSAPGDGTANDHACIAYRGTINAKALLDSFKDVALGVTFQLGAEGMEDRQGKYNLAAFNFFEKVEKMTIENIGSAYNVVVGNRINGQGASSHGVRLTGYGDDQFNTKAEGIVAVGNVINGMTNAYSLQNTAKYNVICGSSSNNISNAVVEIKRPTIDDNTVGLNTVGNVTFKDVGRVILNNGGHFNNFDVIGENVSNIAIEEVAKGAGLNPLGHNKYTAKIRNMSSGGAVIRQVHDTLDLDLHNVVGTGVDISTDAVYCRGFIKVDGADAGVIIRSNGCMLDLHVTNCTEATSKSIVIGGSNCVINLYTDKNVLITGTNNVVKGYVGGTISYGGSGKWNNDVTGVCGYSNRKQEMSKTTDASGCVVVAHGLKTTDAIVNASAIGVLDLRVKMKSIDSTSITFEVRSNADNSLYASKAVSFGWIAEGV